MREGVMREKVMYVIYVVGIVVMWTLGLAAGLSIGEADLPCDHNEVYVIDSGECVNEQDHGRHDG